MTEKDAHEITSKVPEITLLFWIMKIAATTLGETAGDAASMSMHLGYALSSLCFAGVFIIILFFQIKSSVFHPSLYWGTLIVTTILGTTLADFSDRSLGIGYAGGSLLLSFLLLCALSLWYKTFLSLWYKTFGSISIRDIITTKGECFYWTTIMISQTLGTALGDWMADSAQLGYDGGIIVLSLLLLSLLIAYYVTSLSRSILFWMAFIMTRPFGALLGDFLDKPISNGGLAMSRYSISCVLVVFIFGCIFLFPQRAASKAH